MNCPMCCGPVTATTYRLASVSFVDIFCPTCGVGWAGMPTLPDMTGEAPPDLDLKWRTLADIVVWHVERIRHDAPGDPPPAVLTAMSLRAMAVIAITDHTTAQRTAMAEWVLAGLLNLLRERLDAGGES